ncbi:riboflavin kinase, partial [Rhizobium johnstonii]|uniref:riboflavin kinase n=1 Tax=Rhizobium johnstonii TaxID=3019933 RepID=UPI003F9C6B1A
IASEIEKIGFDFRGDLYGQLCSVSFFGYLRPELKLDGLDPLVAQIKRDEEEARALIAGVKTLGALDRKLCFS